MTLSTKRAEYTANLKHQLDELNKNIDTLQEKAKETSEDIRDKYHSEVAALRQQSKQAASKYDELMLATEESWDGMVLEMEKVRDAFKHSFNYFKSQL
jgi:predicted  nucleic acid-binding Zn-ribbon protein